MLVEMNSNRGIVALLALKSSLGVTFTTWAATVACQMGLKGSIHADISKLTALTYLDFGYNLFQGRLASFSTPLKTVPSLKELFLHYNWFAGSIPSFIASLQNLTTLGLFSNYLTGTMPIPSTSLVALDVGFNYLSGSFPQVSIKSCSADHNCFLSSSYCRSSGLLQRPASACAICGSADGQGELCYGGLCGPDSADAVSAGTVNSPTLPMVPMKCLVSSVLKVKSSLGVTDSSWVAASSCTIGGGAISLANTWNGMGCSTAGLVTSLNVSSMALKGTFHADISKLTTLTSLSVPLSSFPYSPNNLFLPVLHRSAPFHLPSRVV
ncbi:unnamed protein product [Closterium sp. Naga37s-1]|nr:unnamed protein product [Closterium sp. Naga37s-1]